MKIVGIIQARMGSTRLPGKVLKYVLGKPLIAYVVEQLRKVSSLNEVILATSTLQTDDQLANWARESNVKCFRGSESDVLKRYCDAAKESGADIIVRIAGDCPLLEPNIADKVMKLHLETNADYSANTIERTFPRGWDVENMQMELLELADRESKDPFQREHVTPFFWQQPNRFHLESYEAKDEFFRPDLRLCVDTEDDFQLIRLILEGLDKGSSPVDGKHIIELFKKHPEWAKINSHVVQKHL